MCTKIFTWRFSATFSCKVLLKWKRNESTPLREKISFIGFFVSLQKFHRTRTEFSQLTRILWYMRARDTRRSQLNVGLQTIFYFASWSETSIFSYCANAPMGKNMLMCDLTLSDIFYKQWGYLSLKRICVWYVLMW